MARRYPLTRRPVLDLEPSACEVIGHATDGDIIRSGIQKVAGNTDEVAVVAETLVHTGAREAGSVQEGIVEVQEPGFFGNRTRIAAKTTSRTRVWVKGRR